MVDLFTGGSCIKLYADDVKLHFEIENDSDVVTLQQSVDKFASYLRAKIQLTIILMMLF